MSKQVVKNHNQTDNRADKLKLYSIGSVVILIGIILFVNILFDRIFGKALTFDFSDSNQNSISQESIDYINSLPADSHIRIVGLFSRPDNVSGTPYQYIIPLLDDYVKESNGKISVEYADLVENPGIINQLDPSNSYDLASNEGSFVIEYNGNLKIVSPLDCYTFDMDYYYSTGVYAVTNNNSEYTFTNTMNMLTSGYSCKAYIVTGLKEEGSVYLTQILNSMAIDVEELESSDNFTVPEDCDLLILNGPNVDIPEKMYVAMTDYLNNGGKMFIAVNYNIKNVGVRYTRLSHLVSQMGIVIDSSLIYENDPGYQRSGYAIDHTLTAVGRFAEFTSLPYYHGTFTRSISPYSDPAISAQSYAVLVTSDKATLVEYDDTGSLVTSDADTTGTYKAAMFAEGAGTDPAMIYVFGTTNFSSDEYISNYGLNDENIDFFRACIRDLTASKSAYSINVATKSVNDYSLDSTKTSTSLSTLIMVIFMIVIPVILIAMAVIVYAKRKNL